MLEALNRLLDDNRELFVPELQETITPHPHFMLFATQNPPGATYGGRKVLSKVGSSHTMQITNPTRLPNHVLLLLVSSLSRSSVDAFLKPIKLSDLSVTSKHLSPEDDRSTANPQTAHTYRTAAPVATPDLRSAQLWSEYDDYDTPVSP